MNDLISRILRSSLPQKMPPSTASEMPLAARMRGLMLKCGGRSVDALANLSMNVDGFPILANDAITISIIGKRPSETFVAVIGKNNFLEIASHITSRFAAAKWVTVPSQSVVVKHA